MDGYGLCFGGTLDVVSGELVVDRAMITLDGTQNISIANWRPTSSGVGWVYPYSLTNNKVERSDANMPKVISDSLPTITYATAFQGTSIGVTTLASTGSTSYGLVVRTSDASLTTASAINAYLSANPITVCYELANPQTIQLTPQEVELLTGTNNVWSDGDVTLVYSADIQKWVEKKLGTRTTLTMSRPTVDTESVKSVDTVETADTNSVDTEQVGDDL
jgi:hypothetical protein